jgi:hypothetical protein
MDSIKILVSIDKKENGESMIITSRPVADTDYGLIVSTYIDMNDEIQLVNGLTTALGSMIRQLEDRDEIPSGSVMTEVMTQLHNIYIEQNLKIDAVQEFERGDREPESGEE